MVERQLSLAGFAEIASKSERIGFAVESSARVSLPVRLHYPMFCTSWSEREPGMRGAGNGASLLSQIFPVRVDEESAT